MGEANELMVQVFRLVDGQPVPRLVPLADILGANADEAALAALAARLAPEEEAESDA